MNCLNYFMLTALYYYTCVTDFYTELFNRITCKPPPLVVYKVVRYFGVDGEEDVTARYTNGQEIKPGEKETIEYRFTWKRDKKYRFVCTRPDDPGPSQDALTQPTTLGKRIVMAVLVNPTENVEDHVLVRVYKFAGPRHDFFHNTHLQMKHMFYNDDMLPGTVLKILWSNGSLLSYYPESTLI